MNSIFKHFDIDLEEMNYVMSVVVLSAGGTINMEGVTERKPANKVEEILKEIDDEMKEHRISVIYEDLFDRPPDSSNVGEHEWSKITEVIRRIISRKEELRKKIMKQGLRAEIGGIVVTHGTDTLQSTSMIVSLRTVAENNSVPIVFTGSHSPIDCEESDGRNNLKKAIYIAKERYNDQNNLLPGVYVLIGKEIHMASRLAKVYTRPNSDGLYFFSYPGPVGQVTGKRYHVRLNKDYIKRVKSGIRMAYETQETPLGVVEHEVLDKYTSPQVLRDLRRRISYYKSRKNAVGREYGVVLQGNFIANPRMEEIVSIIGNIADDDVSICVGSMDVYNEIESRLGKQKAFLIHKSMSHSKAREKLSWLLSLRNQEHCVACYMNENLTGEVFETEALPEWINYETFMDRKSGREVVVAYPDIHWKVYADAIERLESSQAKKRQLALYGFGDGHIPVLNRSINTSIQEYIINEEIEIRSEILENDSINDIEKKIAHSITSSKHNIDYIVNNYRVDEIKMRSALYSSISKERRSRLEEELRGKVVEAYNGVQNEYQCTIKNEREVIERAASAIRIVIDAKELKKEWDKEYNGKDAAALIRKIAAQYPNLLARRLIHDAIAFESESLGLIGKAVDKGIHVRIYTSAAKGKTNNELYENGNKLKILGVESECAKGWQVQYILPKVNRVGR